MNDEGTCIKSTIVDYMERYININYDRVKKTGMISRKVYFRIF